MPDHYGVEAGLVDLDELKGWIVFEDEDIIAVNKPGWLVCHPSKNGPLSSLVGACRELLGLERLHIINRLDRETSGLVLLAKTASAASFYQSAVERREVSKRYLAILEGEMNEEIFVDQPIGDDEESPIFVKQKVVIEGGKPSQSIFRPLVVKNNFTLAEVELLTGRKHQIRVHAQFLGHPVVGDKIYGKNPLHYLEFIEHGWTDNLAKDLEMKRQALHAKEMVFHNSISYKCSLASDMTDFCLEKMELDPGFESRI